VDPALRTLAHAQLAFNAPLSERHASLFVHQLALAPGHHALDLGCGFGELLLRLVAAHPAATGTGVDTDREALDRARRAAAARGLQERVEFSEGDVSAFAGHGHLVVCVGAAHAWDSPGAALLALRDHVEPGGVALFGAGVWERAPEAEAVRLLGEHDSLDTLVAGAEGAGYEVESAELSTR
jgi:cyclopropane fatty-acyl-phospholipid synthase-like methyltransferase